MKKILLLLLTCLSVWSISAQSDLCSGAPSLTVGSSCTNTAYTIPTTFADNLGFEPSCGNDYIDGFYKFTATSSSTTVTMSDDTPGGPNPGLLVAGGACGSFTTLGCSQNANGSNESVTVTTVAGTTYYICIFSTNSGGSGVPTNPTGGNICVIDATIPPSSFNMTNGGITACTGTFCDSGGPTGNYSASENYTFTICPGTGGGGVSVTFNSWNLESGWEHLKIYDGNSTAATMIGNYSGTSPGTIAASAGNATGCLTFVFTSDGSGNYAGWSATISCTAPCQSITANFVSSTEAPMADGIIRICAGETVNFNGSGTFSNSSAGATYLWYFGDGTTGSGASASHTYPTSGSYYVNLVCTDPAGCKNTNNLNKNVQVSIPPTITTAASPSSVCAGQPSNFSANVTMNTLTPSCTPPVSGTTFLPDGSGVSYSTSINVSCYTPNATVTSAADITNVCLNMEHSYLGDLGISLTCPNGQTMSLQTYGSGGNSANLGFPWATGTVDGNSANTTPGTGSNYCFTPTASTTLVAGIVSGGTFTNGNGPATYTDSYVPAGSYKPAQPFTNMIGCPLNGSWTITVTDNLGSDNGYIFSWDVNFAASIATPPPFTPTIVSQGWVPSSSVVPTGATTATVYPNTTGTPCFNYQVTDNFGCTYTQPQCITVGCSVLSVELLDFNAQAEDNRFTALSWTTASEDQNDHFILERSADAIQWSAVATVPGSGTTTQSHQYSYNDYLPLSGLSYYRLGQVDENGVYSYSQPRAVVFDGGFSHQGISVFPNPSSSSVIISGQSDYSSLKITNVLGKNVKSDCVLEFTGASSIQLNISHLSSGVYLISNGSETISFVKE